MRILGAILGAILGLLVVRAEAACSVPFTFVNNTQVADANQVNANFSAVVNCANAIASPFATSALALASLPGSVGTVLVTSPSVPQAVYQWNPAACAFNDGGSQIPATSGGCWKLNAQSIYDIRWWHLPANPINLYTSLTGNDFGGQNFCVVVTNPCSASSNQAQMIANRFCALGGNIWINLPTGIIPITIQQNGPLPCSGNGGVGMEQGELVVNGSGPGTVLTGGPGQNRATDAKSFGMLAVQNLTVTSPIVDLWTEIGGDTDVYGGVTLGAASAQLIHTENPGSQTNLWDSLTVSGGGSAGWLAVTNSSVEFNPVGGSPTVTFVGSPNFSSEIADAGYNGVIYIGSDWVFSGTVTGSKFLVLDGGVLQNNGVTLPGNSGGTISGQGIVDPNYPPTSYTLTTGSLGTGGSVSTNFGSDLSGYFNVTTGSSGVSNNFTIQVNFQNSLIGRVCNFSFASGYIVAGLQVNSTGFTSITASLFMQATVMPTSTNFLLQYQCTGL